jgi:enterochelin esterase family protein
MRTVVLSVLLALQGPSNREDVYPFRAADPDASPRIAQLREAVGRGVPNDVEMFWNEMRERSTPLVEQIPGDPAHSRVTFLWRGSTEARNVVITDGVSIGVGGADPKNSQMTQLSNTDVWYRTYDIRNDGRFTYALSENDPLTLFTAPDRRSNSKPDPLNPNRFLTGQTYLELRDAPQHPWIAARPSVMSGRVENLQFDGGLNVWVYTPADFQPRGERYPLLVTMGGQAYMNWVSVPTILDNLIADKRIPPVVAVMVGGSNADLSCSPEYAKLLADEIVPWMQTTYNATRDPAQTVIGGASLGGLASTFAAVNHPHVFGKVLSQSGSYWWPDIDKDGEWLTRRVAGMPRQPVEFFMEVGRMEGADVQLNTNRRMRDALIAKGYPVQYQEFNGNHNYINWRGGFGEALIRFLGK